MIEQFNSPVGPTVEIPESPLRVFELFFSEDLLKVIMEESNRYVRSK